jgi:PAS domain S-box-containing protein
MAARIGRHDDLTQGDRGPFDRIMPINEAEFQIRGVRDPQLAVYATSSLPVWLWSSDGTRVLWANAAGAAVFGARNGSALAGRTFGPADQHRRQIVSLAGRLALNGATRLERLRGFGASLGLLLTCACARLVFTGGGIGILIVAAEQAGRTLPYDQRVQRLIDDIDAPIAAFTGAGVLAGTNSAAMPLLTSYRTAGTPDLAALGLDQAGHLALQVGSAEASAPMGRVLLQRIGQGADTTLLAFITPAVVHPAATTAPPIAPLPETPLPEVAFAEAALAELPSVAAEDASETIAPLPWALQVLEDHEPPPTSTEVAPRPVAIAPPRDDSFAADAAATPDVPETRDVLPTVEAVADQPDDSAVSTYVAKAEHQAEHQAEYQAEQQPGHQVEHLIEEPVPEMAPSSTEPAPSVDIHQTVAEPSPIDEHDTIITPADRQPHHAEAASAETANPILPSHHPADDAAAAALALFDEAPLTARRHPLRFMWQMDAEGRFALGSDEFSRLIGPHTATAFGRLWSEIADVFEIDPEGRVAAAVATRDTWSGITLNWPADGPGTRLPVELSGLPIYGRARHFLGYRGFGVCRDMDGLARLAAQRKHDVLHPAPVWPDHPPNGVEDDSTPTLEAHSPNSANTVPASPPTETDTPVDTPQNVLPFRPTNEPKTPMLTPVENNAFNELARQLASRLDAERLELDARDKARVISPELFASTGVEDESSVGEPGIDEPGPAQPEAAPEQPPWLAQTDKAPRAESRRDALLYDRMPVGILVYRLDRLLYANKAFLERVGYTDLQALAAAGGLDALYVEPGVTGGDSTSDEGTPVKIAATGRDDTPTDARLHSMSWDGDAAHALIFSTSRSEPAVVVAAASALPAPAASVDTSIEELGTILDATDDAILIFDADGRVITCNRGAEMLFGYDDRDIVQHNLTDLFASDSHGAMLDYLAGIKGASAASRQSHDIKGRDVNGRARSGDVLALSLTIGRTTKTGERFFAICRNLAPAQKSQADAVQAKRQADRAANAKSDILARISHEVRTPLNAIIGFADVMIEERFGALGNDRYAAYMKDIRAAGERVLAIINDLLDLSRAETGKLDLTFERQDLNDMVEKCVSVMQPQANRERIIIRTSLAHALPPVTADAGALRQIVLNLVGNSIHVARAGGQVIVSTALTDLGDVVLRVRDTGRGLNHTEMEAALEQFRNPASEQLAQDNAGISLSLTRALVEANQAQFHIKSAPQSGTLVEVAFSQKAAQAI